MTRPALFLLPLVFALPAQAGEWVTATEGEFSDHWETGEKGRWTLEDGVLSQTANPDSKTWQNYDRYAWFKTFEAANFEAVFDWRCDENSGFYFHTVWPGEGLRKKQEVQIYDSYGRNYLQTRKNTDAPQPLHNHDAGGLIPGPGPTENACKPSGEWNTFHITCIDNQLTVMLNGVVVNEADLNEPPYAAVNPPGMAGKFAIQDHGHAVEIRNMKIRSLD